MIPFPRSFLVTVHSVHNNKPSTKALGTEIAKAAISRTAVKAVILTAWDYSRKIRMKTPRGSDE